VQYVPRLSGSTESAGNLNISDVHGLARGFLKPKTGFLKPKTGFLKPKTGFLKPKTGFLKPKTGFLKPARAKNQKRARPLTRKNYFVFLPIYFSLSICKHFRASKSNTFLKEQYERQLGL
jgi:hypothetical protein